MIDDGSMDGVSYSNSGNTQPWHEKYAYLPKKINGKWVWFGTYYRREVFTPFKGPSTVEFEWRYEYGTIFDVLSDE